MFRLLVFAALFILLAACGAAASVPALPARVGEAQTGDVSPDAAGSNTPVWRIVGKVGPYDVDLLVYQDTGTPPTPLPTPSPTQTAPVTNTPRATEAPTIATMPANTPSPTNTAFATPTPIGTVATTTPAPTPMNTCQLKLNRAVNIRSGAGIEFVRVGSAALGTNITIQEFMVSGDYLWAMLEPGRWVAVRVQSTDEWWVDATDGQPGEQCLAVFGWPDGLAPPGAIAAPEVKTGLHLIFSAQSAPVLGLVSSGAIGSLKGTDGSEWIVKAAKQANPALLTIWRNLSTGLGWRDNPAMWNVGDPRVVADQWFDAQYGTWQTRGLIGVVDYFEYRNEALFVGAWEVAFDLRMLERANAAGICLAAFSDGYGNPDLSEFVQRRAVLNYILAHPCAPGRYHAIASHIYEGVNGGLWTFLRWRLFLGALGDARYYAIPWIFTEYSDKLGVGPADCGAVIADARAAATQFDKYAEVWSFTLFSIGGGTQWTDLTPCLPLL